MIKAKLVTKLRLEKMENIQSKENHAVSDGLYTLDHCDMCCCVYCIATQIGIAGE